MMLPRYLIISLAVTSLLVVWSQFDREQGAGVSSSVVIRHHKKSISPAPGREDKSDYIIDLFPARQPQNLVVQEKKRTQPEPVKKIDPPFPLQVMGAWWENNERIVILSDDRRNVLLCKQCRMKGYIRPGEYLLPEWKLLILSDDHLIVEWQPERISKRIELGDLKSKPTR